MKRICLTFAASALAALFAVISTAGAGTNTTNTPFTVPCTSTDQVCDQSYQTTATTSSKLLLEFESWDSCSNLSVAFYVDGKLVHTSGVLAWSQSTGAIDVGPVASGTYALEVRATGVANGTCNTGTLTSWKGRFLITTNDDPPPPPPTDEEEEPVPTGPTAKADCKDSGWKNFGELAFKNQGQCVKWVEHQD